jgi:hypothetical protein
VLLCIGEGWMQVSMRFKIQTFTPALESAQPTHDHISPSSICTHAYSFLHGSKNPSTHSFQSSSQRPHAKIALAYSQ